MTKSNVGYFAGGVGACLLALAGLARVGSIEAEVGRHGDQIDRLNVRYAMEHPTPSHVAEPALRPEHRHDTAGHGADGADVITRRDSFDRRPSAAAEAEGGQP